MHVEGSIDAKEVRSEQEEGCRRTDSPVLQDHHFFFQTASIKQTGSVNG